MKVNKGISDVISINSWTVYSVSDYLGLQCQLEGMITLSFEAA